MHTHTLKSNMPRLPHHCLIAVCLAGSLLLLPLCCVGQDAFPQYDYDSTTSPEYDYNATFEYSFYSNGSSEDLEKFLEGKDVDDEETETDISLTNPDSTTSTTLTKAQASRTVYPSLLLTVVLTAHLILQFL
ncbi:uncharacterized protein si:ch211-191i18.2 [Colossoma macropomum]|uniref:uncharacterized protein si:ch211-191i18.2 n=1 Tax=Colossoma macropomum TaxID=42526 RepID=UPI0018646BD1|nr:uncharacterized protein si:ch211-191i18.2 [Colossoma macropomum]